jgi:hypothetical protein
MTEVLDSIGEDRRERLLRVLSAASCCMCYPAASGVFGITAFLPTGTKRVPCAVQCPRIFYTDLDNLICKKR